MMQVGGIFLIDIDLEELVMLITLPVLVSAAGQ